MTSGQNLVDVRLLGAVTPDGGQVGYATQHLYTDLLGFAGGDPAGLRVIVTDLTATAKRVPTADSSVRYEVKHFDVTLALEAASEASLLVMRYASPLDDLVVNWWAGLSDDQRARVKESAEQAAGKYNVGLAGVKALLDTRCPIGPGGAKFDENPDYAWSWPESLLRFVLDQE